MPFYKLCICWGCAKTHFIEEGRTCDKCGEPLRDLTAFSYTEYIMEKRRKLEAAGAKAIEDLRVRGVGLPGARALQPRLPLTAASALFLRGRIS